MKRTTIYLEPDLEVLLKLEAKRLGIPMVEVIRTALRSHLGQRARSMPPGIGAFDSGRADVAERAEEILRDSGFRED